MSLLPHLFPNISGLRRYLGDPFGQDLASDYIYVPGMSHPIHISDFFRSDIRRHHSREKSSNNASGKFQVCLDVHQFAPNEIKVKTVGRHIVIEAKHEEMQDEHGYISRHFIRKYPIPEGHEPNEVTSTISSDGILTINAPRDPIILPDKDERIVPITKVGPINGGDDTTRDMSVEHVKESHHPKKVVSDDAEKQNGVPLAIKYNS